MGYKKPELKSYSAGDILEELGPCQSQYTTTTFYTTEGNSGVNVDGRILSNGNIETSLEDIGDYNDGRYQRGFVGFDISSIHSTVVSATLRIYQYGDSGVDPYSAGELNSSIVVDHVNFGSSLGGSSDYQDAISNNIGTISSNNTRTWKTLSVTSAVQADIDDGRSSSQFRLRFTNDTNNDNESDYACFEDAENTGGSGAEYKPQLVVTYR